MGDEKNHQYCDYNNNIVTTSHVLETQVDACCICQDVVDRLKQGHLSGCNHCFHYHCIVTWAQVTNLCPLCKTKFNAVTRVDTQGIEVARQVIQDTRQVYEPEPLDHTIDAQVELMMHDIACELCGSGDNEHVLLLCEALGCEVANHTYCIGLQAVPNTSWYCARHATTQQRASDVIERPAMTVTTRRRTRRLATLMSNVLRGRGRSTTTRGSRRRGSRGFVAVEEAEDRRPIRGIAATYTLRMSRELMQVQQRADAMFARGDLTQSSLYGGSADSALSTARQGTRSIVATSGPSPMDQMWNDQSRSRQELAAAAIAAHGHGLLSNADSSTRSSQRANRVSNTFAPEYCALAKLMQDAVSSDNYASSVALLIPKTAKLRLVSRVKTFFGRLNAKEKAAAVELGCLSVLHQWIQQDRGNSVSLPNSQVLDAVLSIFETLPLRKEDLVEEEGLQVTIDRLLELSEVSIETRQRMIELSEKWCELNPPAPREPPRPQVSQPVLSPVNVAQELPVITAFPSITRPPRSKGKRKRQRDVWSDAVVEYVKAKLYPLYKENNGTGNLTRERFKSIVKEVAALFAQETSSMQSAVLLPSGELSNLAKSRVKKLIDRVYKESSTCGTFAVKSTASGSLLMGPVAAASTYSAVPTLKHQHRI
ncbi:unnamed protein product [Peronospora belbahrii]|uniref:RING-type domain-containing protein n=1 Tax=Peronospora belbahrii TaxID=622444 RepID=A0AAU9KUB6_9STRA|nr:unnamed protein product [Peronospora belbahrii]CAH0518356.1 unnamed protein product [Peronospora belbahrii]